MNTPVTLTNKQKIKNLIASALGVAIERVTDNVTLLELGADDLDAIEIIIDVEMQFSACINDFGFDLNTTIGEYIAGMAANSENTLELV